MKKKHIIYIAITALVTGLVIVIALFFTAGATIPPVVDEPMSPVDADKIVLTGTAEPNAKVTVTGGPYELSPTYADEEGYWEKTVTLVQESTSTFSITTMGEDGETSDAVIITIIEGVEEAQAYEATYNVDRTAPVAPTVNDIESPIDADSIIITGTTEAGATIIISGADTAQGSANSSGVFSVEVELPQNAENKFYVSSMDSSGNMSSSTKTTIEEVSEDDETHNSGSEENEGENDDTNTNTDTAVIFSDTEGHWAEAYILELADMGVVGGYEDGSFGPNDYITRAEITKIALNAFDFEVYEANGSFSDVESEAWYEDYVNSAYEYEIVSGDPEGTFRPGDYVNRAEAMKILLGASGIPEIAGAHVFIGNEDSWENPFSDMTTSDWFYTYVMQAYTGGVVNGYADGTFGGGNNITRAEVCKIVIGLLDLEYEIKATPSI